MIHYTYSEESIISTMNTYQISREDSILLLDSYTKFNNSTILQQMSEDEYCDSEGNSK